jgi:2-oxoisovalerate dehydrogenase E1 component beta subunit
MTYKEALTQQMQSFFSDPLARAVGYGLLNGKGANGTLKSVPNHKVVETTVAENLMVGIAHGMALTGLRPMVYFERADFLACGLSAISNHLDCAKLISRGEFNPCVIIRVLIGNKLKPLFTGPTHTSNPAAAMKAMLRMPVYEVKTPDEVNAAYERAIMEQRDGIGSSMIFEHKDLL